MRVIINPLKGSIYRGGLTRLSAATPRPPFDCAAGCGVSAAIPAAMSFAQNMVYNSFRPMEKNSEKRTIFGSVSLKPACSIFATPFAA